MSLKESNEALKNHIIEKIKKTGYPLEISVSSILDRTWDSIVNQDTYIDRNTMTLCDIDICASKKPARIGNLELETALMIECKKSDVFSWVFFTRPYTFKIDDVAGQYLDEAQMAARNTERLEIMRMILKDTHLHYQTPTRIAVTFDTFATGNVHRDQFENSQHNPPSNGQHPRRRGQSIPESKDIHEARRELETYVNWAIDQDVREWVSWN